MKERGCVACRIEREKRKLTPETLTPIDIHHCLSGGVRRGHSQTVALCVWHHRGVKPSNMTVTEATDEFGPSLYYGRKQFAERYGADDELIAYQEELLAVPEHELGGEG